MEDAGGIEGAVATDILPSRGDRYAVLSGPDERPRHSKQLPKPAGRA
jgi:hypothetical protein